MDFEYGPDRLRLAALIVDCLVAVGVAMPVKEVCRDERYARLRWQDGGRQSEMEGCRPRYRWRGRST